MTTYIKYKGMSGMIETLYNNSSQNINEICPMKILEALTGKNPNHLSDHNS